MKEKFSEIINEHKNFTVAYKSNIELYTDSNAKQRVNLIYSDNIW